MNAVHPVKTACPTDRFSLKEREMTDQAQEYSGWIGHQVFDQAGDKVGKVSNIYFDDRSGQPEWLAISTGMLSRRSSFVPMQGATASGDDLVIGWDKAMVKDAPQVDDDAEGYLSPEDEQELYVYYGQPMPAQVESTYPTDDQDRAETVGHDTSGPSTDDAMTRSEERLNVGTRTQESGRARLRKYVVTEQVTQTVPVSHEEVRLEREPVTDANVGAATDGPEISEEEHEVVLYEERPVVEKEVVPVERVRLSKETVTGEETVNAELRKEEVDQDGVEVTDRES
jgi:uncharacterized protein (TIGR02271 family)